MNDQVNKRIELTDQELSRLGRILAITDLEPQRRIAILFWILAGGLLIFGHAALLWNPVYFAASVPFAFALFMIGNARFGYYKLFRLIHHQHALLGAADRETEESGGESPR